MLSDITVSLHAHAVTRTIRIANTDASIMLHVLGVLMFVRVRVCVNAGVDPVFFGVVLSDPMCVCVCVHEHVQVHVYLLTTRTGPVSAVLHI